MLKTLNTSPEIQKAFQEYQAFIQSVGHYVANFRVETAGGGGSGCYWFANEGVWNHIDEWPGGARYWIVYGHEDPTVQGKQVPMFQINPKKDTGTSQTKGCFLRDSNARLYLAHCGEFTVGRSKVKSPDFFANYKGATQVVTWPGGKSKQAVLFGPVGGPTIISQLAGFSREVERIKKKLFP
ncbi:MAG: hypothetical protein KF858_00695 [Candidatus Sumerlaeia bacterium]|nr:hypothetical protein [Candidatus Sumerlaeia bacterium]